MKTWINNRASAGSGETKCGAGGSRSKLRKNPGLQPGGAGARGGRGTTDHWRSGHQNRWPEQPERESGKTGQQVATAGAGVHLHSLVPSSLTDLTAETGSEQHGGKHTIVELSLSSIGNLLKVLCAEQTTCAVCHSHHSYKSPVAGAKKWALFRLFYLLIQTWVRFTL